MCFDGGEFGGVDFGGEGFVIWKLFDGFVEVDVGCVIVCDVVGD